MIYFHTERDVKKLAETLAYYADTELKEDIRAIRFNMKDFFIQFQRNTNAIDASRFEIKFPSGFSEFSHMITILWENSELTDEANKMVTEMAVFLWKQNIPAVIVSSDNSVFPKNGGYNRTDLPWPRKSR